jgi:hypothetical protein
LENADTIDFVLNGLTTFDLMMLQENITKGQRVEKFELQALQSGIWTKISEGTTIGYKRIVKFKELTTNHIRLIIQQSRCESELAEIGIYRTLPEVKIEDAGMSFANQKTVQLTCNQANTSIYYTTDGSKPDINSNKYKKPISFNKTTIIRAVAFNGKSRGFETSTTFRKALYHTKLMYPPDPEYATAGTNCLTDENTGSNDFADGSWLGFRNHDLIAVVDLEKPTKIHALGIHYCYNTNSWIFPPSGVLFEISEDGTQYKTIENINISPLDADATGTSDIQINTSMSARYIRITATRYGKIPPWHPGHGENAWLFVNEIQIR